MKDTRKLAHTRSKLGPKIRAEARIAQAQGVNTRTRSVLGILMLDPSLRTHLINL